MKSKLKQYLLDNGKDRTWRELYELYPYKGHNLSTTQKVDSVRSIDRLIKRQGRGLEEVERGKKRTAKILVFDLETSPKKAYIWRLWKASIHPTNGMLQSESFMLTYSAKWLFEDNIINGRLTSEEALKEDDSRITKDMWNLFNEADIVIAHNANGFDNKVLNTRFLKHGLPYPASYQTIDTLYHCKRHLRLESNSLNYVAKFLGLGAKLPTTFSLWERCMNGEDAALQEMLDYNDQDVYLLEDVYLKLRPFIKPHPNVSLFIEDDITRCPTCSSDQLKVVGTYNTQVSQFNSVRCQSCGSSHRTRTNILSKNKKQSVIVSTSR